MKHSKEGKKRNPWKTTVIVALCVVLSLGALYQGYRVARDFLLEKVFVYFLDEEQDTNAEKGAASKEQMNIQDVADAFERLNGVEPEKDEQKKDTHKTDKGSSQQVAKDLVSQIPEADKNRAIAIVSSVASVDDCFALYELAINGDQNAKKQLKAIYARFTQAQTDELWSLYEKNKHLLE